MNELNKKEVEIGDVYNIGIGYGEEARCIVIKIEDDITNGKQAILEMIDFGGPLQTQYVETLLAL